MAGPWPFAPTDRTKRVREARDEAKKEIEAYRAQKEAEYRAFEAEVRPLRLPAPAT
jgi:Vacuolar (H+)-ATPase G subunit.